VWCNKLKKGAHQTMNQKIIIGVVAGLIVVTGAAILKTKKNSPAQVTIAFAGDTMLGRLVNQKIETAGYKYPLGNIIPLLHKTDLNIVNLETTLTKHMLRIPKVFNFRAEPDRVQTLKEGRIDIVSLANNHSKDFGDIGLLETIATLDSAGIQHVGAGATLTEAKKPFVVQKNGITIGVIGYTDNEPSWKAEKNKPGTNFIEVDEIESVKKDIRTLRTQVDILIVTLHWGPNMQTVPSQKFVDFAHQLVDAGVDIIHGHSSHVFQGVEVYKNSLIMYDTGDLVDDYHVTPELRNDRSFLFLVTATKQGPQKLKLIPTLISNMQVNLAPQKDAQASLTLMQKRSANLRTTVTDDGVVTISK